jgi:uncharacterized coiled-coil DUF342 family protein
MPSGIEQEIRRKRNALAAEVRGYLAATKRLRERLLEASRKLTPEVFEEVQSKVRELRDMDKTFQHQQRAAQGTKPVEQLLGRAVASMERLNGGTGVDKANRRFAHSANNEIEGGRFSTTIRAALRPPPAFSYLVSPTRKI